MCPPVAWYGPSSCSKIDPAEPREAADEAASIYCIIAAHLIRTADTIHASVARCCAQNCLVRGICPRSVHGANAGRRGAGGKGRERLWGLLLDLSRRTAEQPGWWYKFRPSTAAPGRLCSFRERGAQWQERDAALAWRARYRTDRRDLGLYPRQRGPLTVRTGPLEGGAGPKVSRRTTGQIRFSIHIAGRSRYSVSGQAPRRFGGHTTTKQSKTREEDHEAISAAGCAHGCDIPHDGARAERGRAQERPQDACRCADVRHGLRPPALQPAHADQQAERQAAGAGVVLQLGRQPRPGSAAAAQGRGDLSYRPRKDGGGRCA